MLRRCAADRRIVDRYRLTCEIRDEIQGRGVPGWQLPPGDLDTWDRATREASILLDDILDLADGYGITQGTRIDLSGVDLGEPSQVERDRIAAVLDALPEATLSFEGTFNAHVPRDHVDSPDCWCQPIGPTLIHRGLPDDAAEETPR